MYLLPGQEQMDKAEQERQLDRYFRANRRLLSFALRERAFSLLDGRFVINKKIVEDVLASNNDTLLMAILSQTQYKLNEGQLGALRDIFETASEKVQIKILESISLFAKDDGENLVLKGLKDTMSEAVQIKSLSKILFVKRDQIATIIAEKLKHGSREIKLAALRCLKTYGIIDPEEIKRLILEACNLEEDEKVRYEAFIKIDRLNADDRQEVFEKMLNEHSELIRLAVIKRIRHLKDPERKKEIILGALSSENSDQIQIAALYQVSSLPEDLRKNSVLEKIRNPLPEIQLAAFKQLKFLRPNEKEEIVLAALDSENEAMQILAIENLDVVEENKRGNIIFSKIRGGTKLVQEAALKKVELVPEQQRGESLLKVLRERNYKVPTNTGKPSSPKEDRLRIVKYCEQFEDYNYRLYHGHDTDVNLRGDFKKTGSGLTTLGLHFTNKIVIRHIPMNAFSYWQKAYESFEFWRNHGFEYVPIEPIIDFNINRQSSDQINVVSAVLGMNLQDYLKICSQGHKDLLTEKSKQICDLLKKLGVQHGHLEKHNFCIRFERHPDGTIDIDRVPRLYAIDFDRATALEV